MLPVSGAEQLNASGAIGERPMTSQSGAYSRLVRPIVPWVSPVAVGRQEHVPQAAPSWPSALQLLEDRRQLPAILGLLHLLFVDGLGRDDVLLEERLDALRQAPPLWRSAAAGSEWPSGLSKFVLLRATDPAHAGERREVIVGVAEHAFDHRQALEVVADLVLHGHADAAVQLDRLLADKLAGAADLHLGRGDRLRRSAAFGSSAIIVANIAMVRACSERDQHVDGAVLQHLEIADRHAELLAGLQIVDA